MHVAVRLETLGKPLVDDLFDVRTKRPLHSFCCHSDQQVKENTPLYTNFSAGNGGAPQKGDTLSHADVVRSAAWPTVSSILDKKYVEV